MSLIVENGSGLANAESYASVAGAAAYFARFGEPAGWAAATEAAKEIALRKATRFIEARYRTRFRGSRRTSTQALSWPRVDDRSAQTYGYPAEYGGTDDARYWAPDVVPTPLVEATAILAGEVIGGTDLQPNITETPDVGSESISVGDISRSVTYIGGKLVRPIRDLVDGLLSELMLPADRAVRV